MPRPTTKTELLKTAAEQYQQMWNLINSMSEQQRQANFAEQIKNLGKEAHWQRDKNLRDVLIHLYEWHQLLLTWVASNLHGQPKTFLPASYTWKTYGEMNVEFWKKHQKTYYADAVKMLNKSHHEVMALIEKFSDAELFTKKYFSWTGTSSLGAYCVSATSSHYDWAIKKIKAQLKLSQHE